MFLLALPLLALAAPAAPADVHVSAFKAHVSFLGSDLLEGREAGTRGYDLAAAYVASQFAAVGLEPAGDAGTFLHRVELQTSQLETEGSTICVGATGGPCVALELRKDANLQANVFRDVADVEAGLVFVGFGVTAPDLKHDDYAGLDVRGKVVVVLSGAPKRFPATQRAHHGHNSRKAQLAISHGAVGILTVRSAESERRFPFERWRNLQARVGMRAVVDGKPLDAWPELLLSGTLGPGGAQAVFRGSKTSLAEVQARAEKEAPKPMALVSWVKAHTVSKRGTTSSANVVAVLRGSDPARAGEHVVVTAHLDHLGLRGDGPDRIHNGVLDNASGTAALLEIARVLAARNPRPARSVLFLAVTAEEKGLQGSLAWASRPTVPPTSIVANVNMDMVKMTFPLRALVPMGAEHSSLGPLAVESAKRAGLEVAEENEPEEAHFVRSDQFSFIRQGTPALAFRAAAQSTDPAVDAVAVHKEWDRKIYHQPIDDMSQPIHWESGARWAQANLNLVEAIANAPAAPRWNAGDFFGRTFGRGAK
jgi:hypothetical protein